MRYSLNQHPNALTGKYRIRPKVATWFFLVNIVSLFILAYMPKDWDIARAIALMVCAFMGGIMLAQHAAIWEPVADSQLPRPEGRSLEEQ